MKILAAKLREEMGWASTDPVSIHALIRKKGIIAVFRPLEDDFSGMALRTASSDGTVRRFMLVNTAESRGKQRFTVCHELYHLLFQDRFESSVNQVGRFDENVLEEYKADVFAANLLLPELGIETLIPPSQFKKDAVTLETVLMLEHNYRCSRTTLLRTLKEMQLITSEKYNLYSLQIMYGAAEYGYDLSLYKPSGKMELIGDYHMKARQLFDAGKISRTRYLELLDAMQVDREVTEDGE